MENSVPHRARKRFGQHFLHDSGVIRRIVDHLQLNPEEILCEIGPGRGALSDCLVETGNPLHLIEIDRDLVPTLVDRYSASPQVNVHEQDALRLDLDIINPHSETVLVGNLPYNISTALLIHLLSQSEQVSRMVFMVQKEVGDRLSAQPGISRLFPCSM